VTRIAEFGAFVELEPGVEALAHASTFPPTGGRDGWSAGVAVGTTAAFQIVSLDVEKKRIGVAPVPGGGGDDAEREHADPAEGFGSLADKLRGALGPQKPPHP
jgi:small subunit ribosomal protein S1